MTPPKCCSTKKGVNNWVHISETRPNQLNYPWFSKCPLNLSLEKPILINSVDMSHLPPFSHWSIRNNIPDFWAKKWNTLTSTESKLWKLSLIVIIIPWLKFLSYEKGRCISKQLEHWCCYDLQILNVYRDRFISF